MKQELKILKTTNKSYNKVEKEINKLINSGACIESIETVIINQHLSQNRSFYKETEILVFVLYKIGGEKQDEDSM